MTLEYIGELSIGAAIPGALTAALSGQADLQAKVDALASFSPSLGDFNADLTVALQVVADLQAVIALGLTPPSLSAQLTIVADALAAVQAQLQVILDFQTLCAEAGLFVYHYSGQVDGLGTALDSEVSGGFPGGSGSDDCDALILGTTTGATWDAMSSVFQVTP